MDANAEAEDRPRDSVFFKDPAGEIFHTYSTFGRGGEEFLGIYRYLDGTPKGRDENGPYHTLADWVRPRNMYGRPGMVEANGRYHSLAPCTIQQPAEGRGNRRTGRVSWRGCCAKPYSAK
jgi:hypothetical protein